MAGRERRRVPRVFFGHFTDSHVVDEDDDDRRAIPDRSGLATSSRGTTEGQVLGGEAILQLASISRELSYNDPDSNNGEDGSSDARGSREDRNVELLVRNPYSQ